MPIKIVRKQPLNKRNPFRSTGAKKPELPTIISVLPRGVQSVEAREKAFKEARRIERENAKTFTKKEIAAKQLEELQKRKKLAKIYTQLQQLQKEGNKDATELMEALEEELKGRGRIHLHRALKPLKPWKLEQPPIYQVEDQKRAVEDRQRLFKNVDTLRKGTAPSRERILEAMPELAEPLIISFF